MNATIALIAVGCAVLSYAAVGRWRVLAQKYSAVDVPNERSAHTRPTPRGGGLPIVVLTVGALVLLWAIYRAWSGKTLAAYVIAALAIAAVSLLDDVRRLSATSRFVCHIVCAVVLLGAIGHWTTLSLPWIGEVELGWLGIPLTLVWVQGLLNAYNFMDGVDGLAGTQAVIAGAAWAAFSAYAGLPLPASVGVLVAATSLGFLAHNWAPAHVFMGDVGSVFLGFTFAALPLMALDAGPRVGFAGALILWPFIFDTSFTMLRRLRRGEKVWTAHRSHLYQRLLPLGYSHRFLAILYSGLAVLGVMLAASWIVDAPGADTAIITGLPLAAFGLWVFVVRQERAYAQSAAPRQAGAASQVL